MLIDYESYIPVSSKIVGKTIQEVERQSGLKIDHYHNSPVEIENKISKVDPEMIIQPGMSIKIFDADSKKLANLRKYFELP
ncbi:MAG: hypothetical protein ABII25_04730 [bacterium]